MKTDNELIAEFMGYVNTTLTDKDFNIYEHPETKKLIETMSMQFHTSWDWLMPVVDKIMKTTDTDGLYIRISWVVDTLQYVDVLRTYKAVVEFIKWYNKQKS